MNLDNFIAGLEIIRKYYEKTDGYHLGAEHDIIYVYATERPISDDDLKKLCELNWHQPEVDTGDEDFEPRHYDPEEGWAALV